MGGEKMSVDIYQIFGPTRFWYHYLIILFLSFFTFRYVLKRLIFVRGLSTIPGPPAIPILGNSLSLTGGQEGKQKW